MNITPFYTALLAILYVFLSIRTIGLRRRLGIGLGDSGNPALLRAIRVHANFSEYVPLALLLLYLMEVQGANAALLHGLGASLLAGRLAHAFGVSQVRERGVFRVVGMAMTFAAVLTASGYLLLS